MKNFFSGDSGIFVDRYGTVKSTIIFGALCTVAAVINAVTDDFTVMMVARFVLGLGSEPLIVAITTALAKWFKGRELSFAFGINLTIARLGSVAADWSPTWAKWAYDSWQGPLMVAAVLVLVLAPGQGGHERFRVPAQPLLMILAAYGMAAQLPGRSTRPGTQLPDGSIGHPRMRRKG